MRSTNYLDKNNFHHFTCQHSFLKDLKNLLIKIKPSKKKLDDNISISLNLVEIFPEGNITKGG